MLIVARDYFSKWVEARAVPQKGALETVNFLLHKIITRHGVLKTLISDQGTGHHYVLTLCIGSEFRNELMKKFANDYHFNHRLASPNHPATNGLVKC